MCTLMICNDTHSVRNEVQLHYRTITTQWRKIKLSKHMKWRERETERETERQRKRERDKETTNNHKALDQLIYYENEGLGMNITINKGLHHYRYKNNHKICSCFTWKSTCRPPTLLYIQAPACIVEVNERKEDVRSTLKGFLRGHAVQYVTYKYTRVCVWVGGEYIIAQG